MLDLCLSSTINRRYYFMPVIRYDSPEELKAWADKCRDVGVEIKDTDTVELLQRLYAVAIKPPGAAVLTPPPVHPAAGILEDDDEPPALNRRARRQSKFAEQGVLASASA